MPDLPPPTCQTLASPSSPPSPPYPSSSFSDPVSAPCLAGSPARVSSSPVDKNDDIAIDLAEMEDERVSCSAPKRKGRRNRSSTRTGCRFILRKFTADERGKGKKKLVIDKDKDWLSIVQTVFVPDEDQVVYDDDMKLDENPILVEEAEYHPSRRDADRDRAIKLARNFAFFNQEEDKSEEKESPGTFLDCQEDHRTAAGQR